MRAIVGLVVVSALLVVVFGTRPAQAQSGQNGSIVGGVYDQSGTPLRGIKVVAKSETQIGGARTAYSNDEGAFRFVALHPGTFEIRASGPKMRDVIVKAVEVGISAPAEVNVVMEVETSVETVSVVERAPMVNTTSAALKETIDLEMIESIPHDSRDNPHRQMIGSVPGAMGRNVRGGTESQTLFTQDGFDMREQYPTMKTSAAYEILTGGHGADSPTASGGAVNLVTKSGSNRFELELNATGESNLLQFFRDESDSPVPSYYYVINPTVAGPIIKDRLWFFANTELHIDRDIRALDPAGYYPERSPFTKTILKGSFKLSWQVTTRNKLTSLSNFDMPREYSRKGDFGVDKQAQERRVANRLFTGLTWESLLSDTVVLRSQAGFTYYGQNVFPERCITEPEVCDHIPQTVITAPRRQFLDNNSLHERQDTYDLQFQNNLQWFAASKALGEHAVSVKSNFFAERDLTWTSTPGDAVINYEGATPDNKVTYYSNDPRLEPARYGWFIREVNWRRHVATLSDAWRPTRHLTISPAISHVWATALNSQGDNVINNQAFSPSIAVVWDATHDGRTALRASYNNYADVEVEALARHTLPARTTRTCDWNNDAQDFTSSCSWGGGANRNTFGMPCGPDGYDDLGNECMESLKIPRTYEYTAGAEREIVQGLAVSLDGIYRKFTNQYDTRETNRLWNPSGTQLDRVSGYKNGRNQTISDFATPDHATREYIGGTLAVRKRAGRLQLQGSYTLSQLVGNAGNAGDNPGQDVYLYSYLGDDHRHEIKGLLRYQLTTWLTTGIRYAYRTGTPYNRLFRNDVTSSFVDYRARRGYSPGANINDPGDDRELRLPDLQSLNAQLRINLQPLIRQRLEFYVDVLNVLALRTVTGIEEDDGPAFGLPTGRSAPFRIRLGMNYKF